MYRAFKLTTKICPCQLAYVDRNSCAQRVTFITFWHREYLHTLALYTVLYGEPMPTMSKMSWAYLKEREKSEWMQDIFDHNSYTNTIYEIPCPFWEIGNNTLFVG